MPTDKVPSKLTLAQWFFMGLCKAVAYRTLQRNRGIPALPKTAPIAALEEKDLWMLGKRMKKVLNVLFFWHPGPCYYRSYTILYVLRRAGVEIELNFGMKNPFAEKKKVIRAHCWLSYKGRLFLQDDKVLRDYPSRAAEPKDGISFWWVEHEKRPVNSKGEEEL
jgi:hypothetical protein